MSEKSEKIDLNNDVVLNDRGNKAMSENSRLSGQKGVVLGEANEVNEARFLESEAKEEMSVGVAKEEKMDDLLLKECVGKDNGSVSESRIGEASRDFETGKEGSAMREPDFVGGSDNGVLGAEVEKEKGVSLGGENAVEDSGSKLGDISHCETEEARGDSGEVERKAVEDSGAKVDGTVSSSLSLEAEKGKEDFAEKGKGVSLEAKKGKVDSAELERKAVEDSGVRLDETSCSISVESEMGKVNFAEKGKEVSLEAENYKVDSAELERKAVEDSSTKVDETNCSLSLEPEKEKDGFSVKEKEVSSEAETDKKNSSEMERKAVKDLEAKHDETSCQQSLKALPCVSEASKPKSVEATESSIEVGPSESTRNSNADDGSDKAVSLTNNADSKVEALPCVAEPKSVEATESPKEPDDDVPIVEGKSKVDRDESFRTSDSKVVGDDETVDSGGSQNGTMEVHLVVQPKSGLLKGIGKCASRYANEKSAPSKPSFDVGDLIWGKVRSHPWWPGQICDPSAASKKAKKYFKRDAYLVAYYGDNTFAWNEASRVKPFLEHFHQMVKLSNTEEFHFAIDCALDEVSRRVEFGLACSCLSEEAYSQIESQVIDNAGIREEESRRVGGDGSLTVDSFEPVRLVEYIKELAQAPNEAAIEKLDFAMAQSELLAFARWKGYTQLPEFTILGTILEMDAEVSLRSEEKQKDESVSEKGKSELQNSLAAKRKLDSKVSGSPSKKKKSPLDAKVEKKKHAETPVVEKKQDKTRVFEKKLDKARAVENGSKGKPGSKKRKTSGSSDDDDDVSPDSPKKEARITATEVDNKPVPVKQSFRVGDRISKVASQLNSSSPILKNGNGKSKSPQPRSNSKEDTLSEESKHPKPEKEKENSPSGHSCSEEEDKQSLENLFGGKTGKKSTKRGRKSSRATATELPNRLGPTTESYWSDRIGKSVPEDEDEAGETKPNCESDSKLKVSSENPDVDRSESLKDGSFLTALVLKFPGKDSVPSKTNLNKIFSSYRSFDGSKTEFLKNNCVKVVFRKRDDAEEAFSSAGKPKTFKHSLVSYHLKYISSPSPNKSSSNSKKQSKKNHKESEESDS